MKYVSLEHVENIVRRYCGASESIAVQEALYSAPELFRELDDVPNIQESEALEMRVKTLNEQGQQRWSAYTERILQIDNTLNNFLARLNTLEQTALVLKEKPQRQDIAQTIAEYDQRISRLKQEYVSGLAGLNEEIKRLQKVNIDLRDEKEGLLKDLKSCADGNASLSERLEKQRIEIVRFQKGLRELLDSA